MIQIRLAYVMGLAMSVVVMACSTDAPECWAPSEQGSGAGGAPVVAGPSGGGFGDAPNSPQDASGNGSPCGDEQRYANCKIAGASAPFTTWSGFVNSLSEAAKRCQEYADTHGKGTCSEANCEWEPDASVAAKWTCSGYVDHCTGCKDADCSFAGNCASVTGKGSTESKAKKDALDNCEVELDERAPGLWWDCSEASTGGLTCKTN